jgi:N-methylhydantoinase A
MALEHGVFRHRHHAHVREAVESLAELESRASRAVEDYGFTRHDMDTVRRMDLRFKNQEYTITVELDPGWNDADDVLAGARKAFVDAHRRLYGHGDPAADLELVSVRARAIGRVRAPSIARRSGHVPRGATGRRAVHFPSARAGIATEVSRRDSLASGQIVSGPAIIEEWTMTTFVPPGWLAQCDDYGNLILEPVTHQGEE